MAPRIARAGILVLGLGLATAAGLLYMSGRRATPEMARVHVLSNGVIPGRDALPVRFQPFDEPELDRLATHENLHALVNGIPRQFDQILRLQDWVNAQWADGTPAPYPPWNALIVLDWIRSGKTGGFCAQYAQVFLQSLAALGFTARYVEIGSRDNPYAHYVTEVWSNDFDKWVLLDADYNVHFERHGVPMSALEIHDALLSSTLADVVPVFPPARHGHASPMQWPLRTAALYYYVRYHLNASQLTRPHDPPFDRFNDMIEFGDVRATPWEVTPVVTTFPKERLTRRRVSDPALVDAKLNQIQVTIRGADADRVTFDLRDNVLGRASYEYRVVATGTASAPWQSTARPRVILSMPEQGGRVEIRGVNLRGVTGPTSTLLIDPARALAHPEPR